MVMCRFSEKMYLESLKSKNSILSMQNNHNMLDVHKRNVENRSGREETVKNTYVVKRSSSVGIKYKRCCSCDSLNKKIEKQKRRLTPLTPASLICYAVIYRDNALLQKLIGTYPLGVNELSEEGVSPLHLAALDGNIEIMKILLDFKAKINILDIHGRTVLDYAVASGQFDAAQFLMQTGADTTKVKDGILF